MIRAFLCENRKNLKLALKVRGNATSATGSPASKMTTARQVGLEAMMGFVDEGYPFVPPPIYTEPREGRLDKRGDPEPATTILCRSYWQ